MENETLQAIREAMAKTFFATAWADWTDEYGEGTPGMGTDIMDIIPDEYPDSAYKAADKLIRRMEKINKLSLLSIFDACRNEPGDHHRDPNEQEFGYCMAMQAMGHGVGWDDNHPSMFHEMRIDWVEPKINRPQRFDTPDIEYTYFDLPSEDYPIPEDREDA